MSPETLTEHRLLKTPVWKHIRTARLLVILTVPLIYACAIPFALLDFSVTIYQAVCFPIFRVPKVRRRDYLIFDRGRLAYLNAIEKVGCVYCSYANGLLAYIAEIAARTEQRFCPIKHAHPQRNCTRGMHIFCRTEMPGPTGSNPRTSLVPMTMSSRGPSSVRNSVVPSKTRPLPNG